MLLIIPEGGKFLAIDKNIYFLRRLGSGRLLGKTDRGANKNSRQGPGHHNPVSNTFHRSILAPDLSGITL